MGRKISLGDLLKEQLKIEKEKLKMKR